LAGRRHRLRSGGVLAGGLAHGPAHEQRVCLAIVDLQHAVKVG